MKCEEWKPVIGYEGHYEVSNYGRVQSLDRRIKRERNNEGQFAGVGVNGQYAVKGRIMKTSVNATGHPFLSLRLNKRKKTITVHSLVLTAFSGPRPYERMQCRHLDGNPTNNHISNLKWGTPRENQQDRIKHGTMNRGEDVTTSKLTNSDVHFIRYWIKTGLFSQKEIAAVFGVCFSTIQNISSRKTWGWLKERNNNANSKEETRTETE